MSAMVMCAAVVAEVIAVKSTYNGAAAVMQQCCNGRTDLALQPAVGDRPVSQNARYYKDVATVRCDLDNLWTARRALQ
jgi:hypothetical protein